jgi:hypothetical protein
LFLISSVFLVLNECYTKHATEFSPALGHVKLALPISDGSAYFGRPTKPKSEKEEVKICREKVNKSRNKRNERKQLCTFAKVLSVTHRGSIGVRRPHRDWIFVYFSHRRATNRQRRVASVRRHAESIYDPRWFASACAIFSAPAARRVIRVHPRVNQSAIPFTIRRGLFHRKR